MDGNIWYHFSRFVSILITIWPSQSKKRTYLQDCSWHHYLHYVNNISTNTVSFTLSSTQNFHPCHFYSSQGYLQKIPASTLIGETFARETFGNFANFGHFRESLSRESFQNGNSRKFIQWNFSETPIRESLSSEICKKSFLFLFIYL